MKRKVIAVAGGTGSGKTTFASALALSAPSSAVVVCLDWYYHSSENLTPEERAVKNYDHPDSLDFGFLIGHLRELAAGKQIIAPRYDFAAHVRSPATAKMDSADWIIVEGILVLHDSTVRQLCDRTFFVDAPAEVRFQRRLLRDMSERGRTRESVEYQWKTTVQPMHEAYCEPTKALAHESIDGTSDFRETIKTVWSRLAAP